MLFKGFHRGYLRLRRLQAFETSGIFYTRDTGIRRDPGPNELRIRSRLQIPQNVFGDPAPDGTSDHPH